MPLPNTRVAIVGAAAADKEFTVVEISAREAQRIAKDLATNAEQAKREIERMINAASR